MNEQAGGRACAAGEDAPPPGPPAGSRAATLAWAADGAAHLRGLMARLGEDAFAARSALPGWTRAQLLCHLARNADAMINLLTWAGTGVPTPAYAGPGRRAADIEAGALRRPAVIREDVLASSDRLAAVVRAMPEQAWSATVPTPGGVRMPAETVLWIRARELWIHAVDLDVGASFADLPAPMAAALLGELAGALSGRPDCPPVELAGTDQPCRLAVGGGPDAVTVAGPVASLVGWLLGRSRGKDLRAAGGARLPVLPRLP